MYDDDGQSEVETIADGIVNGEFVRTFWHWDTIQPEIVFGRARIQGETINFENDTEELLSWLESQPTRGDVEVDIDGHAVTVPWNYLSVMVDRIRLCMLG